MYNGVICYMILTFMGVIIMSLVALGEWLYTKVDDAWQRHMKKVNELNRKES